MTNFDTCGGGSPKLEQRLRSMLVPETEHPRASHTKGRDPITNSVQIDRFFFTDAQAQQSQAAAMINAVLVFNNNGQPRLTKFYTQLVR